MKKFKKLIALTCVAAMLVPSIAFAAEPETAPGAGTTSTGNSVVENDNSTDIKYTAVVLPTIDPNTYNFTIDRDGLLREYDSANKYNPGDSIFFKAEEEVAKIELKEAVSGINSLVEIGKNVHIDGSLDASALATAITSSALYTALTADTFSTVSTSSDLKGKYFVWSPAKGDDEEYNGKGEWVEIVFADYDTKTANYADYLDLTGTDATVTAVALVADPLSGTTVWDGNIYTLDYAEIDGDKAVEKYNIVGTAASGITSVDAGLYIKNTPDAGVPTYTALTADNDDTYVTFTEATEFYNAKSDKAAVVNKSTNPIAVSVDVTVAAPGLTFSQTGTYTDDTAASVYFTLNADETTYKVLDTTGKATAYYVLDGVAVDPIRFQGTDTNTATGSKNYYKYESPVLVNSPEQYDSQDFYIEATANTEDDANEAWDAYIADLNDAEKVTIEKPTITVVYNWVPLNDEVVETADTDNPATEDVENDVDIKTYKDATEKEYVTLATNGWVVKAGETEEEKLTFEADATPTWKYNTAGSGYYCTGSAESVTSATAYLLDSDNKYTVSSGIDVSSAINSSNTAVVKFDTAPLDELLTTAGKYGIIVVADGVTYKCEYTVD